MKMHLILPVSLFFSLLTAALATGNALLWLLALMVALTVLLCLASVIWASASLRVSAEISGRGVRRGEDASLLLRVSHRCPIPIAPVILELSASGNGKVREIRLKDLPGRIQTLRMPVHAAHVGVYSSGILSCTAEDLLGIFSRRVETPDAVYELTVLPQTFTTEPVRMAPGDPGSEIMARATEDLNAPSDTRAYQPGDAMKKIHWKLSLRKGELMVRKFEEPALQDVLILTDCSRPPSLGHPEAEADLRDAILETSASVFADQCKTDHNIRMPLSGSHPVDVDKSMGTAHAFEYLARVDFSETDRFERVIMMESRRMRKVGFATVITSRLNSALVDIMIRVRRTGPNLRLYLVTFAPDDPKVLSLVSRLRNAEIEVSYVTPDVRQEAGA